MSIERFLKYASIGEMLGVGVYFLALAGGFFLSEGNVLYKICEIVAGFLWYTLGILFFAIVFMVMIALWRYLLQLNVPRTRELTAKPKEKMPIFWIILSVASFMAYISLTAALMGMAG